MNEELAFREWMKIVSFWRGGKTRCKELKERAQLFGLNKINQTSLSRERTHRKYSTRWL